MFDLNPLNLPDAQLQQGIMMGVAGILGFLIGYVSLKKTIAQLEEKMALLNRDIDACYRSRVSVLDVDGKETTVLDRIRARSGELNFARIGSGSADSADDLRAILGIGPFLEKKLHAIWIYRYQQLANLTREDTDKVNDIIEFFPGRIERDNWVGQAADLMKKRQMPATGQS